MASGSVFSGFRESTICFLQSYRRVKGAAGRLAPPPLSPLLSGGLSGGELPHTPIEVLRAAYTLEAPDGTARVPSYTDRVLFASLPGQAAAVTAATAVTAVTQRNCCNRLQQL